MVSVPLKVLWINMHLVILRDYGSSCSFCIELVGAWKFLQYLQDI